MSITTWRLTSSIPICFLLLFSLSDGFFVLSPANNSKHFSTSIDVDLDVTTGLLEDWQNDIASVEVILKTPSGSQSNFARNIQALPRLEYTRRDSSIGKLIPEVFKLGNLPAGLIQIIVRVFDSDGNELVKPNLTTFEVVLPFVTLDIPESTHIFQPTRWRITFPESFTLGEDGIAIVFCSEGGPFLFNDTSSAVQAGVLEQYMAPSSAGIYSCTVFLIENGQHYRNRQRVVAEFQVEFTVLNPSDNQSRKLSGSKITLVDWMFGPHFLILSNDTYVSQSIKHYGVWSDSEIELFTSLFDLLSNETESETMFVLDIGANIGSFSVPLGQHIGKRGRVIAVEAHQKMYQLLTANVVLAGLDNVDTFNFVVANQNHDRLHSVDIQETPTNAGSNSYDSQGLKCTSELWLVGKAKIKEGGKSPISKRKIKWRKLDTFLSESFDSKFGRIVLVKIDVEGFEIKALSGFQESIRTHRPLIYFEADRFEQLPQLFSMFEEELGYSLFWSVHMLHQTKGVRNANSNIFGNKASLNILAIPEERLDILKQDAVIGVHLSPNLKVLKDRTFINPLENVETLLSGLSNFEFGSSSPNGEDGLLMRILTSLCVRSRSFVELVGPSKSSWGDNYYPQGVFTKALEKYLYFKGEVVDVSGVNFTSLLSAEWNEPDLLVAMHSGVDLEILCALLCGTICEGVVCPNRVKRQWFFRPRIAMVRPTLPTRIVTCRDDGSGIESRLSELMRFANSVDYKIFHCDLNGMTCFMASHSALFWNLVSEESREKFLERLTERSIFKNPAPNGYPGWCKTQICLEK